MSECKIPPQSPCQGCGAQSWSKMMDIPSRPTSGGDYPFVLTSCPYWENGVKKYPVMHNKGEYQEYLKRNDLVCALDGEDPTIGPSQRSVHDSFIDPPPPSENAVKISEGVKYASEQEVQSLF